MSKMIQLRHVPDALHRQLKARAALEGLSLSDFLIREARKIADCPTPAEIRERLARREHAAPRFAPADAVRHERDQR
jgi:antitoxin FitA